MIFSIIIGTSLLSFCFGDSSKKAISSISFHRQDVPLSYQYSAVHLYDTEKTKDQSNSNLNINNNKHPEIFRNIQYAPLIFKSKGQEIHNAKATITSDDSYLSNIPSSDNTVHKGNLEPQSFKQNKGSSDYKQHQPVQFIAGYNIIEIPKKLDTNNSELTSENRNIDAFQNNKNYLTGYIRDEPFKNLPKHVKETTFITQHAVTEPDESSKLNRLQILKKEQLAEKPPQSTQVLSALENKQIQPIFNQYVKIPRVHVNVARAHKIAHVQHKAPANGIQNILISKPNLQFIPFELVARNTLLHPAKGDKNIIKRP